MTDDEVAAIGARAEAATPGPWAVAPQTGYRVKTADGTGFVVAHTMRTTGNADLVDAEFIAHARTDVPALVAEVQRLRALVAALVAS